MLQQEFDKFVESYNKDFFYLLARASTGSYDCLITFFRVLKDLHDMIKKLQETTHLEFHITPYPLAIRANDAFLQQLGFSFEQIKTIYGFLTNVKETQGKEFEQCIEEGVPLVCTRASAKM
jgi:hypothetical protein